MNCESFISVTGGWLCVRCCSGAVLQWRGVVLQRWQQLLLSH
jgi:hypothetical protein